MSADDVDVDALCAELDDIMAKPSGSQNRGSYNSQQQTKTKSVLESLASKSTNKPATSSFTSTRSTNSTAFTLSDDSDEDVKQRGAKQSTTRAPVKQQQPSSSVSRSSASSNVRSSPPVPPMAASGFDDSDEDFNNLIADMDSAIEKNPASLLKATKLNLKAAPVTGGAPVASTSSTSSFGSGSKSKCFPTLLSNGSPTAPKTCAALLCVACDQRVICLKAARWRDSVVEYMFFRNHYPDVTKMQAGVERDPTSAAYACACSWQTVGADASGSDTLDLNNLKGERSRVEGCSDRAQLKWRCTGH